MLHRFQSILGFTSPLLWLLAVGLAAGSEEAYAPPEQFCCLARHL